MSFSVNRDIFLIKNIILVKYMPKNGSYIHEYWKKLTRFERARILGARAIQISMGAKPLVDIKDSLDPIDIAYEELKAGVLPLDVIRDE